MTKDDAFDFLHHQLKLLARRIEHLEGKVAQLHAESIRPGLMIPTRREFQQLEERVQKLETP